MNTTFTALIAEETPDGVTRRVGERTIDSLPQGEVLIRVHASSLNYKDALSATGHKGITRKYPHTPGIDAAGVVAESTSAQFTEGDEVLVTGYDLGMNTSGGFAEYIRVPEGWVVPKPASFSFDEIMAYGTAGFTAGLCVYKLEMNGVLPESGPVLVTGASGGVGSLAVAMLAGKGYHTVAATGKEDAHDFLRSLGAADIVPREAVNDTSGKPLLAKKYAGAVDTVGGTVLSTVIRSLELGGSVAACGLTQSHLLNETVYPFILRGVNLLGIGSAETDMHTRLNIWKRIDNDLMIPDIMDFTERVTLYGLEEKIQLILKGGIRGRVVVEI